MAPEQEHNQKESETHSEAELCFICTYMLAMNDRLGSVARRMQMYRDV